MIKKNLDDALNCEESNPPSVRRKHIIIKQKGKKVYSTVYENYTAIFCYAINHNGARYKTKYLLEDPAFLSEIFFT